MEKKTKPKGCYMEFLPSGCCGWVSSVGGENARSSSLFSFIYSLVKEVRSEILSVNILHLHCENADADVLVKRFPYVLYIYTIVLVINILLTVTTKQYL